MPILTEWIWGIVSGSTSKGQIPSTLPSPASTKKHSRRAKRSKRTKAVAMLQKHNSLLDNTTDSKSNQEQDQPSTTGSGSTPTTTATSAVGSFVENTSQFFQDSWLCCHDDSDTAHHFLPEDQRQAEEEQIAFMMMEEPKNQNQEEAAAVEITSPTPSRLTRLTSTRTPSPQQQSSSLALVSASASPSLSPVVHPPIFQPPISQIAVYHPKRAWPDGTLQIVWQPPIRNVYNGVDHYTATLNLTLVDSLPTVNVQAGIELHPNEGTSQIIGRVSCYVVRPSMVRGMPSDCPAGLRRFLKNALPQLVRQEGLPSPFVQQILSPSTLSSGQKTVSSSPVRSTNALQQHLWERHHWHSSIAVSNYVYMDHIDIDPDYRGSGMGFCLLEDACRRVADRFSWMIVETPVSIPLANYFGLFGFEGGNEALNGWMTRWNASHTNPLLEEVLPSVPFTTHQSRQQGFHL